MILSKMMLGELNEKLGVSKLIFSDLYSSVIRQKHILITYSLETLVANNIWFLVNNKISSRIDDIK